MSAVPPLRPLPFHSWGAGFQRPLLIGGPCSAESPDQVMRVARELAADGRVTILRAGIWKPRTRPGQFEGAGDPALRWMREATEATGLRSMVEVATPGHVEAALHAGVDIVWIGARTTPNPFSVQEIANALRGVDIPVFVKNPINPDLGLWVGALERLHGAGIQRIAAIHRGFSWFERTPYRNSPMWEFPIRLKASFPDLEIICDPSHIAGKRDLLGGVAQQALDLGLSGLMLEVHPSPENALSDSDQQLTPRSFTELLDGLTFRLAGPTPAMEDRLEELRDLIDQLDEEIARKLGARMDVAELIGDHKRANQVAILQPERWERIMNRQLQFGRQLGLEESFIREFMDAIHRESIRRQTDGELPTELSGTQPSDHSGLDR